MDKFTFTITAELPVDADVETIISRIGKEGVLEHIENDVVETIEGLTDLSNVQVTGSYQEQGTEAIESEVEKKKSLYAKLYLQENIDYINRQLQFSHVLPEQRKLLESQLTDMKKDLNMLTPEHLVVGLPTTLETVIKKGDFR